MDLRVVMTLDGRMELLAVLIFRRCSHHKHDRLVVRSSVLLLARGVMIG